MVNVGSHRLLAHLEGEGTPTVVIEAGITDHLENWRAVQEGIARVTRVVTYNRAGYRGSEAGLLPRDSGREVAELKALLDNASVPGPYVVVGHSLGGLNAQVFAARYPADGAGIVLLALAYNVLSRTEAGKHLLDRAKLKTPIFGEIIGKITLLRFTHTLATTISAGIDIIGAINLSGAACGNAYFRAMSDRIADRVSAGSDLAQAMRDVRMFPPLFVRMAGVGEKTGSLATMLDKASKFYDREIKAAVTRTITLAEAGVTVIMGLAVAMVSISIFLPLYKMLALVRR